MNVASVKRVLMRTRLPEGLAGGQEDKAFMVDQHGLRQIEICEVDALAPSLNGRGSTELLDPGKRKPGDTNHMQVLILNPQA